MHVFSSSKRPPIGQRNKIIAQQKGWSWQKTNKHETPEEQQRITRFILLLFWGGPGIGARSSRQVETEEQIEDGHFSINCELLLLEVQPNLLLLLLYHPFVRMLRSHIQCVGEAPPSDPFANNAPVHSSRVHGFSLPGLHRALYTEGKWGGRRQPRSSLGCGFCCVLERTGWFAWLAASLGTFSQRFQTAVHRSSAPPPPPPYLSEVSCAPLHEGAILGFGAFSPRPPWFRVLISYRLWRGACVLRICSYFLSTVIRSISTPFLVAASF